MKPTDRQTDREVAAVAAAAVSAGRQIKAMSATAQTAEETADSWM